MLSIEQAVELIRLKDDLRIDEFFDKARKYGIRTPEMARFEQEYISGRYYFDFYSRLHAYINLYAHTQIKERLPDNFDIFFSFSSKNHAQAEKIVMALRSAGFSVFFSNYELSQKAGEDFFLTINNALKNCKHLVLYCTPDAMNSRWVNQECGTFFSQKHIKDERKHHFFIVEGKSFNEETMPMLWRNIQRVRTAEDILQRLQPQQYRLIAPIEKKANPLPNINYVAVAVVLLLIISLLIWKPWKDKVIEENPVQSKEEPVKLEDNIPSNELKKTTDLPTRYTETINGVSFDMILVEKGTFIMGCEDTRDGVCNNWEKPTHEVTLTKDYFMGETEVTQKLWKAVMGNNPSYFKKCDDCPVEQVSWDDIQEFIKKLNEKAKNTYYLPSEVEWEYAARGGKYGKNTKYAGSYTLDEVAWISSNSGSKTQVVKGKKPNELGFYDLNGNVYEWCSDWYSSSVQTGTFSVVTGSNRTIRGGSWGDDAAYCRLAYRYGYPPKYKNLGIGWRLCAFL